MSDIEFQNVPENIPQQYESGFFDFWATVINNMMLGKTNNTGSFTITANAATTVVTSIIASPFSTVLLMPKTANAAGALATTYITPAQGEFTVNHANNAQTDRDFNYVVIG